MTSNFPGSVDDIPNDVTNATPATDTHPNLHNQLADAVMAVQTQVLAGGAGMVGFQIQETDIALPSAAGGNQTVAVDFSTAWSWMSGDTTVSGTKITIGTDGLYQLNLSYYIQSNSNSAGSARVLVQDATLGAYAPSAIWVGNVAQVEFGFGAAAVLYSGQDCGLTLVNVTPNTAVTLNLVLSVTRIAPLPPDWLTRR